MAMCYAQVEVAPTWGYIAELETAKWHLIVEDSSVPADIRWFHVLQVSNRSP